MRAVRAAIIIFLIFCAGNAYAQDALFTLPPEDPMARLLEPEKQTQTLPTTTKEALDLYLDNCAAQKHPTLSEEHTLALCLCTASNIEKHFKAEDIPVLFKDTKMAQRLKNSVLERAFAPCMQDVLYDVTLAECQGSREFRKKIKNHAKVCTCQAQGMRAMMSKKSEWLTAQYLQYDKDKAPDPLAFYMLGKRLGEDMELNLGKCLQWHEWGWETPGR